MIPTDMARDATRSSPPPKGRWIVLYDADCGFCKWLLARLLDWDVQRRLTPLALDTEEADELLADLSPAQRTASWHLVAPDGTRTSAGAALAVLAKLLPGGALPAAGLGLVPGLSERGYGWVADHRSQLSRLVPSRFKQRADERIARRD
jgi:predicted DCC family thiol-disulfide oxidoreductase YuxK